MPNLKRFHFALLVSVVLLVLFGAAFYKIWPIYEMRRQAIKGPQEYSLPATETVRKLISPSEEKLKDWKVISNEELGIEVKHPSFLNSRWGEILSILLIVTPEDASQKFSISLSETAFQSAEPEKTFKNFQEVLESIKSTTGLLQPFISSEWIEIAGQKSLMIKTGPDTMGISKEVIHVYYLKDNQVFEFSIDAPEKPLSRKQIEIFEKILSTIKFIDETANWKVYRDVSFEYEIKYPPEWYLYQPENSTVKGFWLQKYEGEALGVWVDVKNNYSLDSVKDWWLKEIQKFANFEELKNNVTITPTELNGILGTEIKTLENYEGKPFRSIYLPHGTKIYEIYTNIHNVSLYKKTLDQMFFSFNLLFFKKISWAPYQNNQYKFRLNIPSFWDYRVLKNLQTMTWVSDGLVFQAKFIIPDREKNYEEIKDYYRDIFYISIVPQSVCQQNKILCTRIKQGDFGRYLIENDKYLFIASIGEKGGFGAPGEKVPLFAKEKFKESTDLQNKIFELYEQILLTFKLE